jgi:hypothetical protein
MHIKGTIELNDGSTSEFSLQEDAGWQQWGAAQNRLGRTVTLLDALAAAAVEFFDADDTEEVEV